MDGVSFDGIAKYAEAAKVTAENGPTWITPSPKEKKAIQLLLERAQLQRKLCSALSQWEASTTDVLGILQGGSDHGDEWKRWLSKSQMLQEGINELCREVTMPSEISGSFRMPPLSKRVYQSWLQFEQDDPDCLQRMFLAAAAWAIGGSRNFESFKREVQRARAVAKGASS